MSLPVVLCTQAMHPDGLALLADAAQIIVASDAGPQAAARLLGEADYLVVRSHLPADFLDRPHRLRAIVRHGTGLDMVPMEAATLQGIPVANVPGANAQAVAEHVVGCFFELARRHCAADAALRASGWTTARAAAGPGVELAGKTVGVVGVGDIGRRIAGICSAGMGMRVLGYQPDPSRFPPHVASVPLRELLEASDFVSLNCPLTEATWHLVDAERLGWMKRTAFLVNASRGDVVDESALAAVLVRRQIAGAALDVFSEQPIARDHAFLSSPHLLLTPHIAAITQESLSRMSIGTATQLLQLMRGQRPDHLVNPQVWPANAKAP